MISYILPGIIISALAAWFFYWLFVQQKILTRTYQVGDPSANIEEVNQLVDTQEVAFEIAKDRVSDARAACSTAVGTDTPDDDQPAQDALKKAEEELVTAEVRLIEVRKAAAIELQKGHTISGFFFDHMQFDKSVKSLRQKIEFIINQCEKLLKSLWMKLKAFYHMCENFVVSRWNS